MDIKSGDMTLDLHVDNLRIGISNTELALEKAQRELRRLRESYLVLKQVIDKKQ